eukprot:TRINITY_DN17036_c0_g1_i1.p1 TRINITY_DN17036_c0_g1~~TRINITY_DN17036_c0_g1_i1.p1  ORF type:complete len:139 (-),score=34.20 TRINITY_DN17036_c0_g1_i1:33-449(-)
MLVYILLASLLSFVYSESCADFGFQDPACRLCNVLEQNTKSKAMYAKCKECCVEDKSVEKFLSARLIYCASGIHQYPHIQAFINSEQKSSRFDNLHIVYKGGAIPTLLLEREDGSQETRAIEKWKTEHLEEFLTTHLQ